MLDIQKDVYKRQSYVSSGFNNLLLKLLWMRRANLVIYINTVWVIANDCNVSTKSSIYVWSNLVRCTICACLLYTSSPYLLQEIL